MAGSPRFKVFNSANKYVGCAKELELAAVMVGWLGEGASVRWGHTKKHTVFTQGVDGDVSDSIDDAVEIMTSRLPEWLSNEG